MHHRSQLSFSVIPKEFQSYKIIYIMTDFTVSLNLSLVLAKLNNDISCCRAVQLSVREGHFYR